MQFAINYSPQAAELLKAGQIAIDYFKCPDWDDMIAEARALKPVYIHFPITVGRGQIGALDWNKVDRLLRETGTPLVNVHLSPMRGDFPRPYDPQQVIDTLHRELAEVVARYGADKVIAENVPHHGDDTTYEYPVLRPAAQPDVIRSVIEATNCGFLFDLSHARISADALGLNWREYVRALPLERIREVHITGMTRLDDGRLEDHLGFTEADWEAFDWFMDEMRAGRAATPWIVSFEYGGTGQLFAWRSESSVIARDVPRLYQAVHSAQLTVNG